MDDTNTTQANPTDGMQQPAAMPTDQTMPATPSMADVASMTPPPAPMQPEPAPVMPDALTSQPASPMDIPMPQDATAPKDLNQDDYAYAEDILEEILDSLDRIEAKLDAIEKKQG